MKITDIEIYRDDTYYSAFPSLLRIPSGEIICAFRRAPDKKKLWGANGPTHTDPNSYLMLVRSADGGMTWSKEPELIYAHPLGGSQDPCMILMSNGSILCSSYAWTLLPPGRKGMLTDAVGFEYDYLGGYILKSDDAGKTWIGPIIPPPVEGSAEINAFGNLCPAYNRGAMAEDDRGILYWAIATEAYKGLKTTSVHLLKSFDFGETWKYACPIAADQDIIFNETSLIITKKGDLIAFIRTENYNDKAILARSTDGGASFEPWEDAGFIGHPCHATRLKDDRIFLIYGYRHEPFGIRAKILDPNASDIATAPEIIIRDDGGTGDVGYPWAIELDDGRIFAAYYINKDDGIRYIAGSILDID